MAGAIGPEVTAFRLSRVRHYCDLMVPSANAAVYYAALRVAALAPSPISSVKATGLWSNNSAWYDVALGRRRASSRKHKQHDPTPTFAQARACLLVSPELLLA